MRYKAIYGGHMKAPAGFLLEMIEVRDDEVIEVTEDEMAEIMESARLNGEEEEETHDPSNE